MVNFNQRNQELYYELNKIRSDPKSYIPYLLEMTKNFNGRLYKDPKTKINLRTKEGIGAITEAINYLKKTKPKKKLNKNPNLEKAAKKLSDYIGVKGLTNHQQGNYSMKNRIKEYVNKIGAMGENISFGNIEARDVIVQLVVDDGVRDRGHRENCFSEKFLQVGISSAQHKGFGYCVVFNFFGGMGNCGGKGGQGFRTDVGSGFKDLGGRDFGKGFKDFGGSYQGDGFRKAEVNNFGGNFKKFGGDDFGRGFEKIKMDGFGNFERDSFGKNFKNLFQKKYMNQGNIKSFKQNNNNFGFNSDFGKMQNFGFSNNKNSNFGNSGRSNNLENSNGKYQIPKSEWPKNYVSMSQSMSSKTVNGNTNTVVTYNFVLANGQKIERKKQFNY